MMPPNLRSVVAQGWRSIGSRRSFSSCRCNIESEGGGVMNFAGGLVRRTFAMVVGYSLGPYVVPGHSKEVAEELEILKEQEAFEQQTMVYGRQT